MLTLLTIVGAIFLIIWITKDLMTASLVIWIVAAIIIAILLATGHAHFGVWW